MSITLGRNIAALKTLQQLNQADTAFARIAQRLSTGQRINSAADDAAGLSVAANLNVNVRVFSQALRNVNDGISALSIADSGLESMSNIVSRIRELATQAANGTFTTTQRLAMQGESDALVKEYNRIAQTTKFNGIALLADQNTLNIQVGSGTASVISSIIGRELSRTVGDGTLRSGVDYTQSGATRLSTQDINGDGKLDLLVSGTANAATYLLGNGDGTFKAGVGLAITGTPSFVTAGDVNNDGIMDIVSSSSTAGSELAIILGTGGGSFAAAQQYAAMSTGASIDLADVNSDGYLDVVMGGSSVPTVAVLLGNGNGSFKAKTSLTGGSTTTAVRFQDLDGDGYQDVLSVESTNNVFNFFHGNGNGTFRSATTISLNGSAGRMQLGDLNRDGKTDVVITEGTANVLDILLSNGNGTFLAVRTIAVGTTPSGLGLTDFNGDGLLDLVDTELTDDRVRILLGNGDGTFAFSSTQIIGANAGQLSVGDFNSDGVSDLAISSQLDNKVSIFIQNTRSTSSLQYLSLATSQEAAASLSSLDAAADRISLERSNIGAQLSRYGYETSLLQSYITENEQAAVRITDADIAQEAADYLRTQIRQQVTTSVLAHAINDQQLALRLLTDI